MANNYLQFSVAVDNLTKEEKKWLTAIERARQMIPTEGEDDDAKESFEKAFPKDIRDVVMDVFVTPHGDLDLSFDMVINEDLWIYAEEAGNPEAAAELIHRFFKKFRPGAAMLLSWAETCSKMRINEFGGGEFLITGRGVICTPWVLSEVQKMYEKRPGDPKKMLKRALKKRLEET